MKLTRYGVSKSLSVLKSHLLCSQQQSVFNIMDIGKVRNIHYYSMDVSHSVLYYICMTQCQFSQ